MPSSSKGRAASVSSSASQSLASPRSSVAPMSERQQMALLMQLTSEENAPEAKPPTPPPPEKKRNRKKRNNRGETPLHIAAIRGDHEQVAKLLAQTRKPDVCDFAGWTPLHEACSYGWYQVVEVLVEGGANVNAKGLDDDTPLHDAATSGNLKMVKFLVEHGADPNLKNSKGKSPVDYATQDIYTYLVSVADSSARATQAGRSRDDSAGRKGNVQESKRTNMDGLAQDQDGKAEQPVDKGSEGKDENKVTVGVVSSTQDEGSRYYEDDPEEETESSKRKKRKESDDREAMGKPAPVNRGASGRILTGTKVPGPASKTGAIPLGKGAMGQVSKGSGSSSSKGGSSGQKSGGGKSQGSHQSKSSSGKSGSLGGKDRKSPVSSPKPGQNDDEEREAAPKVPPLKIVIPGGASASASRIEQEGEGGGQRGGGKGGRGSTLPYVIPCTADPGQASDSSDASDDKRSAESVKVHEEHVSQRDRSESRHGSNELHPRKRKIKSSKESHSRDRDKNESDHPPSVTHSNPYQMYIHIRKQIDQRQKTLFPVKPKPPKDFNKYLMNRCTYTLQGNVTAEPQVEPPPTLPPQMRDEFMAQEKERHRLRIQHLVEKEKLVLAVEQEILRVHGRAERAVANQSLPFSVCTMLRDKEVYNVLAPEQDEKRNAQRSRCNGRQINSWLQEVDDKWEKIKEGMLRRQHTEAETLHAVQTMGWEWKLKELALCDYKTTPKIDPIHVPQIHVSNFDLPA